MARLFCFLWGDFLRQLLFSSYSQTAMKFRKIINLVTLLAILPALSGCWYLLAGGAGAYGGYKMKEKGYTLQNPITKEKSSQTSK
ncbi:hypothetical protein SAMN05216403_12243 [Nitrosospira multiformis ATCC 25196]|nr:hypothetical protein SAMN05216411_1252 [Nitrosospira multiformis]SEG01822.1 hypothetical protein SAMN05216403_12243 [Nitrosospira multiformis ATCC 25196]